MSVTRPPQTFNTRGSFGHGGPHVNSIGQILCCISPSAPRVFARQLKLSESPPEDTGLPPFCPVFYSRGSKGPNGGPPVHIQGLLIANFSLYISICVFSHVPHLTAAAGLCAVSGTPPLFQTGLPLPWDPPLFQTGLLHSRVSEGTSGGSPIEAALMLLPRCAPVHAFKQLFTCSGTFCGSPGATGRTLPLSWGAGRGPLCPTGRSNPAGLQHQDPKNKQKLYHHRL